MSIEDVKNLITSDPKKVNSNFVVEDNFIAGEEYMEAVLSNAKTLTTGALVHNVLYYLRSCRRNPIRGPSFQ